MLLWIWMYQYLFKMAPNPFGCITRSEIAGSGSLILDAQMVEPAKWESQVHVRSLDQKDPLEKGMTTHSAILAWRILYREKPGRLLSTGSQRVRHNWTTNTFTFFHGNFIRNFLRNGHTVFHSSCTVFYSHPHAHACPLLFLSRSPKSSFARYLGHTMNISAGIVTAKFTYKSWLLT